MSNESDTQIFAPEKDNSTLFGVSIRGWIAMGLCFSIALSHLLQVLVVLYYAFRTHDFSAVPLYCDVKEPLYSMGVAALGFYLGQKAQKK